MTKSTQKFLRFNDQTLLFLSIDGTYWIAVKPICDAIGLEWTRQFKNLKEDEILSGALAKQPMHDSSGRVQEMVALPEIWIYGWLFSIRSDNAELLQFKRECYQVLFNHFHGTAIQRLAVLQEKSAVQIEIEEAEAELKESAPYKKVQRLKNQAREKQIQLNKMDAGQLAISFGELEN